MLKEIISQGNFAIWPSISLLMFFITFSAILLWVRRKGNDDHFQYMADLTLDSATTAKEQNHE